MAKVKNGSTMLADPEDREAHRTEWLDRVRALVVTVSDWAEREDWATRKIVKEVEDTEAGNYLAPALLLQHEAVRLFLEPIGLDATGREGYVDLYRMPYYDDIATLYSRGNRWYFRYLTPGKKISDGAAMPKTERFNESLFKKFSDGMKAREI